MNTTVDTASPNVVADLVAAYAGREGLGLRHLRDAIAQIEETIRQRILSDARALGVDADSLAAQLDGAPPESPQKPAARAPKARPEAPADDAAFLALLDAELAKGPATALGLAKRFTGVTKDRVHSVLGSAHTLGGMRLALHGLKWSRVAT